jgi:hypothetical protein
MRTLLEYTFELHLESRTLFLAAVGMKEMKDYKIVLEVDT